MDYIIRNFNQETGQLNVEYGGKWVYAVDLPIENGEFPTGDKLEEIIQSVAPVWLVEREAALSSTTTTNASAAIIAALVQPYPEPEVVDTPVAAEFQPASVGNSNTMESDIAFIKEVVNEVLAAKGL